MKPYKPICAVDSERLIVMDDKVKFITIEGVFLRVVGIISLAFLTIYGILGGVTSKPVMDKLIDLDKWVDNPANAELLFYTGIGLLVIVLFTYVLWVFLLRKKQ